MFHLLSVVTFVTFAIITNAYQNYGWNGGGQPVGGNGGYNTYNPIQYQGQKYSQYPRQQPQNTYPGQQPIQYPRQQSPQQYGQASPPSGFYVQNNNRDSMVIGLNATQGQYPFQASIEVGRQHLCGGTLISSNAVVTAAHCVQNRFAWELIVLTGTTNRLRGGIRTNVTRIIIHPQYNSSTKHLDIAVLILKNFLRVGPADLARLPKQNEKIYTNARCIISGWGTEGGNGIIATNLKYIAVPLMDHAICKKNFPLVTDSMICVGSLNTTRNACPGDSGGPLTKEGVLLGVFSWGYGCGAPYKPAVFTYVAGVSNWIDMVSKM